MLKNRSFFLLTLAAVAICGCKESPQEITEEQPPKLIDAAGREYLWNIEHQVNLLKETGFSALGRAISSRDREALKNLFPPDFIGAELPGTDTGFQFQTDTFSVRSHKSDKINRHDNLPPLADRILEQVESLGGGKLKIRIHVITLSPLSRDSPEGQWQGTAKIEVACRADGGALSELVMEFNFMINEFNRERLDQSEWLTDMRITKVLIGKTKQALMRDATAERGIPIDMFWDNWKVPRQKRMTNTGGVYLTDFNNDGLHDMFVTDLKASFMFIGEIGGTFRDATRDLRIRGDLGGGYAAFVDLDGDGWEDLVHGIAQHPDGLRVYQNKEGRFFEDVTTRSNLPDFLLGMPLKEAREKMRKKEPARVKQKATGISIADYDLDGKVDLYVTRGAGGSFKSGSWIDGKSGKTANNQLLRNLGNWQFEDVTGGSPLDGGQRSTSNAVWIHADKDMRPDLYVIDEFGDGILLANKADGTFKGIALNKQPTDFGSMGMTAGDINNDGHTDIYIAEMYSKAGKRVIGNIPPDTYNKEVTQKLKRLVDGSQLYLGKGGRTFQPAGIQLGVHAVGWAWGASLADLNNDGWLDLYATAGFISHERGKPDG
ncbi:MAG: VCBS repeat-containing protein [Akkermansiaceae bacterium]|nr:VCBS repeat-containing protein [Akkermansiaceae bacterium]